MRQMYVAFRALQLAEDRPQRCCTDEPSASPRAHRSIATRRARKVRTSVPTTLRVLRQALRLPPIVVEPFRAPVLSTTGERVGHVHDVVIELRSGRTHYAVAAASDEGTTTEFGYVFVPVDITRVGSGGSSILLDERKLTPGTRERLLVS